MHYYHDPMPVSNNYWQDLNQAIELGIYIQGQKPKKAELYARIAEYNAESNPEPDDEPVTVAESGSSTGHAIPTPDVIYLDPEAQLVADMAALEEAGDEAALQAALLAMDAAEDAQKAAQPVQSAAKARTELGKKTPEQILEELEALCADVESRGSKAIAAMLGTSVSRLSKRVKAYQILMREEDIFNGFMAGQISYSTLQEAAVRRDGLSLLRGKLTA